MNYIAEDIDYRFVPYAGHPPDTNIVIFGIKRKQSATIRDFNPDNLRLYSNFSIRSELGEREHSYSQTFFLSHTRFTEPEYSRSSVDQFLRRCEFKNVRKDYVTEGLDILRATVMNPYIVPMRCGDQEPKQDTVREFVMEMHRVLKGRSPI